MRQIARPTFGEFSPHASVYVELVPHDINVLECLFDNLHRIKHLVASLSEDQLAFRYQPDKWSIKQIVGHLIDDERIYVYRAMRFARGVSTELSGFDQDKYAAISNADPRSIHDLLAELENVRMATIAFFEGLADEALTRCGVADGSRMSVRGIAYHITGHELRHMEVIRNRYLSAGHS